MPSNAELMHLWVAMGTAIAFYAALMLVQWRLLIRRKMSFRARRHDLHALHDVPPPIDFAKHAQARNSTSAGDQAPLLAERRRVRSDED